MEKKKIIRSKRSDFNLIHKRPENVRNFDGRNQR